MARTNKTQKAGKRGAFVSRSLRKGNAFVAMLGLLFAGGLWSPPAAYADALSDAKAELTAAQKELNNANAALTQANNAFASVKAAKQKVDTVNSQANSSNGIVNDIAFSGQAPLYVQVNGQTSRPDNPSTLVAVPGQYVTSQGEWTKQGLLNYINQVRYEAYKEGLVSKYVALEWSDALERTAQIRAAEISIYGDHMRPSGEKWHGLGNEGLQQPYGENLSWGANYYYNVKMWVDEKADYLKYKQGKAAGQWGHYSNLINMGFTKIGIAHFTTNRSTVNPYGTAMAAELAYNVTGSGSTAVKPAAKDIYQGVFVRNGSLGAIGANGAATFNPRAVSGDPVFYCSSTVNEAKALAKAMAGVEWNRIAADYNAKQSAVNTAQSAVNAANAKVTAAQKKVDAAQPAGTALGQSRASTNTTTQTSGSTSTATTYSFKDVPTSHSFYADIIWMATKGITQGYADGTFRPSDPVSRAAFAAFMYRLAGSPSYTAPKTSPFVDVPTTHQFYKEISWMANKGISKGWTLANGKKEFRPDLFIGRDAIAAFLYRAAGSPSYTSTKTFKDCTNNEHRKAIEWMATVGISTGWSDGTFRPSQLTERGAMAAFLHRFDSKGYKVK